ncbi:restriction endonuclease [Lysinibacter cavernae]|uniref:Restriction system protein n=1 Tax=Lysinibacter cavernae TaxID=1640652 RepID=A0A7X5R2U0_9MICO|nr:restriction endonuclease [Lysinibacter cavernae]NIH54536.1 restriction system protein [Lysinibacter cavernae]
MSSAWVIRSGKFGERDQWAISNGLSGAGFPEIPDLTGCTTREDVAEIVRTSFPEISAPSLANITGQLWALRARIQPGDLLIMPLKTTKQIAMGRVRTGYSYRADEPLTSQRHIVEVDWQITDLPRTEVKQDLLYTLGSALSIFAPTKNHAVSRLEAILRTGTDPGQLPFLHTESSTSPVSALEDSPDLDDVDEPELHADIVEVARDRITARIAEEFAGHDLTLLIMCILEAEGFTCTMAPPGPDGGIDIVAGRGLFGMDSPRLIVQVKSGSQVADPVVRDLSGVVHSQGADQGLLVAWGGLTRPARVSIQAQQFRLRAWTADDVVDAVMRSYDRLPEEIQTRLPLKQVWMLAE